MWFPTDPPSRAALLLAGLLLAGAARGGAIHEHILPRAQWPQHTNGTVIAALPAVRETLRRFAENGQVTVVIRYPGGDSGHRWAMELYGWLVSFGVPTRYLEVEPGAGAADRLVVSVIDRS